MKTVGRDVFALHTRDRIEALGNGASKNLFKRLRSALIL